ncbi:permease [Tautonia rosea]|uniref:permease n=1 Tax=Tautonia rosea TaxID=2728037 RepID=UPI001475EC21|nr:permease [Tautonia rosea]
MDAIFWGGIQRLIEALTEASPTILVGLVIAAIFHRLTGREGTRRLFGEGTRWALPRAWAIGMLLPVCSLGAIPIVRQMRRDGISGGTILAFALTAPLFNPLSVLYGLSLSEPVVILSFAMASLLVVTVVGLAFDRLFPGVAETDDSPPAVSYGLKRMAAMFVSMAREAAGPTTGYILIGLLGVVLLNVLLPAGSLMSRMEQDNPYAALEMTAVAIPAYATPMIAMGQLGSMFQHGNSVSAAFVLLTLGAGANLGLLAWILRSYGLKRAGIWFVGLLAMVVGLAYAMDDPLTPKGIEPAGHTHAFDIYCCPYHPGSADLQMVSRKLSEEVMPHEVKALGVFVGLGLAGLALGRLDRRWRIETWLERPADPSADRPRSKYDLIVPAPVLGGVALIGLIAFSVLACYSYYPPADQIFDDLGIIKAEVLTAALSGDADHAEYFIPLYQDWTRRLQVSVYLREGSLSPYRRIKAQVLIDKVERLKHALEEGDRDEIRYYFAAVTAAHQRMRDAYRD